MKYQERPVTTSISLEPSKLEDLEAKAPEKGCKSRNALIYRILTDWLNKENKKKSA